MNEVPITIQITAQQDTSGRWYLQDAKTQKVSTMVWNTIAQAEEAYGTGTVEWDDEAPDEMLIATCIGCGCDDLHACLDDEDAPCYWLRLDRTEGLGVCSECPDVVEAWDSGDRENGRVTQD